MGPRAGLDGCEKSHPQLGFDPQTVQPVVSHYTDRAIPVHSSNYKSGIICSFLSTCCMKHHLTYTSVSDTFLFRDRLHDGVIRDVQRQQRRKTENMYLLQQQIDLTRQLKKIEDEQLRFGDRAR